MAPKQLAKTVESSNGTTTKVKQEAKPSMKGQAKPEAVNTSEAVQAQPTSRKPKVNPKPKKARAQSRIEETDVADSDAGYADAELPVAEEPNAKDSGIEELDARNDSPRENENSTDVTRRWQNEVLDEINNTRNDLRIFQTEFHHANSLQKFELRPGPLTTYANGAMLIIPTGRPPLSKVKYNIGYNIAVKGYKGQWEFMSFGSSGSEEWNAHDRLVSRGVINAHDLRPTADRIHNLRQQANGGNDGLTAGIVLVWSAAMETAPPPRMVGVLDQPEQQQDAIIGDMDARRTRQGSRSGPVTSQKVSVSKSNSRAPKAGEVTTKRPNEVPTKPMEKERNAADEKVQGSKMKPRVIEVDEELGKENDKDFEEQPGAKSSIPTKKTAKTCKVDEEDVGSDIIVGGDADNKERANELSDRESQPMNREVDGDQRPDDDSEEEDDEEGSDAESAESQVSYLTNDSNQQPPPPGGTGPPAGGNGPGLLSQSEDDSQDIEISSKERPVSKNAATKEGRKTKPRTAVQSTQESPITDLQATWIRETKDDRQYVKAKAAAAKSAGNKRRMSETGMDETIEPKPQKNHLHHRSELAKQGTHLTMAEAHAVSPAKAAHAVQGPHKRGAFDDILNGYDNTDVNDDGVKIEEKEKGKGKKKMKKRLSQ